LLVERKEVDVRTHRDLRPTGVAAVKAESHHLALLVFLTLAGLINEMQASVVNVIFLQETAQKTD